MIPPEIHIGPIQFDQPHKRTLDDDCTPVIYAELNGRRFKLLLGHILKGEVKSLIKDRIVCLWPHLGLFSLSVALNLDKTIAVLFTEVKYQEVIRASQQLRCFVNGYDHLVVTLHHFVLLH
jgi:hypothetical protein